MFIFNNKKGAMFGLDARIALAIFGALSIIAGASLYSAIRHSKIVAVVAEMSEVSKAVESYLIDTGVDIARSVAFTQSADINEMYDSTAPGWSGPYLQTNFDATNNYAINELFDNARIYIDMLDDSLFTNVGLAGQRCTASSTLCFYWIKYTGLSLEYANEIDTFIDGSINETAGKARTVFDSSINSFVVWIKGPRVLIPNG